MTPRDNRAQAQVLRWGHCVEAALTVGNEVHIRDLTLKPFRDAGGRIVGIIGTAFDVTERDRVEEALRKRTYDLDQRMNELRCLYSITHLVEIPGITLDALLQAVADTLPSGWQYPGDAAVRIMVDGREYWRGGPGETPWKQRSPIIVHGECAGEVEVRYLHEKPGAAEGPFLREERMLLDAVAERPAGSSRGCGRKRRSRRVRRCSAGSPSGVSTSSLHHT